MIRRATPDDVAAIVSLERLLFGPDAWSQTQVGEELTGVGREVLVDAGEEGEEGEVIGVIGYLVTRLVGEVADLQRIGVRPDFRRRGVAARLLEAALERPAVRMLLEVAETNTDARAFYATRGFVEIHRRGHYYRDGSDALVLERNAVEEDGAMGRRPGTMTP